MVVTKYLLHISISFVFVKLKWEMLITIVVFSCSGSHVVDERKESHFSSDLSLAPDPNCVSP